MSDKPRIEAINRTVAEAARGWNVSQSFIKRARSHGLIRVVYFGDRPLIPPDEYERVAREGLPSIPKGYVRQTTGPTKAGRPRKVAKTAKPGATAEAPPPKRRRKMPRSEERARERVL